MIVGRKTKSGQRHWLVRLRGPDDREYAKTFRTKKEAETYEAQQRADRSRGGWVDPRRSRGTFAEVAAEWLRSNPGKRGGTLARDETIVRLHLLPTLGARAVGAINRRDVQALVNDWSTRLAPRTVKRQFGVLTAIFAMVVDDELVVKSPCRGVKLPEIPALRRSLIEVDQLPALAEAVGPGYAPMVWVAATLGLRWGECAGLRVRNVDFLRRTVRVAEQRTRGLAGVMVEGPPKSAAGVRILAAPTELMDLLAEHLACRGVTAADDDAYVFVGTEGGPLRYDNWRHRVWAPAVEHIGLPGLHFHDLRRVNATLLVAEGVDPKTAQTRLGHSDVRLTLQVYAQASGEADRRAADTLGSRLLGADRRGHFADTAG